MDSAAPPLVLGCYRLDREIGRGGMGIVYSATSLEDGGTYAVKVLDPETVGDDTARRRFAREAANACRIVHPHAVRTFDVGESAGLAWIAMELVEGRTLADIVRAEGARPPGQVAAWVAQLAQVLDAVHAIGIAHRDIKPSNVMVQESGPTPMLRLLDFGLSRDLNDSGHAITVLGKAAGTPGFMSPEQRAGLTPDHRADVFSLAALAGYLLAGRMPVAAWAMSLRPEHFGRLRRWPPTVDAVLAHALAHDAGARTASAGAFSRAFSAAVREWPPDWVPTAPDDVIVDERAD